MLLEEAIFKENKSFGDLQVLDHAVASYRPVKPNVELIVLASLFLSLAIALTLAFTASLWTEGRGITT